MVSIAAKAPKSLNVRLKNRLDSWTFFAFFVTALIGAPIITVIVMAFTDTSDIWQHLYNTVLGTYVQQTLLLMIGVGVGVTVIGTSTAWLVTMCRFPGSRIFEWALLLPLAVPGYVLAFVITDQLEYAGTIQVFLRDLFGWTSARDYWFPKSDPYPVPRLF